MILFLIYLIDLATRLFVLLLIIQIVLSYFVSPFHPIRQTLDRVVEPLLNPVRRVIPPLGMFDFSPFILIILVQLVGGILKTALVSLSF
ncbi:MAG: YggT family protein [Chloroflexi bacterium]|nr:YggT family protein [Chloroflexota bacterium]